jgi:carbon starvation protein CstA
MLTYGLGLIILVIGGFFYGLIVDKVFHTDAKRITPAYYKRDGIDYVPMPE